MSIRIDADSLDITERPVVDESVTYCQYRKHAMPTSTDLNTVNEMEINIDANAAYLLPSNSYILFEGRLTKTDGTPYAAADVAAIANNGFMYLFTHMEYKINDKAVEHVDYPGQTTTMLGIMSNVNDFSLSTGQAQYWQKDHVAVVNGAAFAGPAATANAGFEWRRSVLLNDGTAENTGYFSITVPLKSIFGFANDYKKVIYGAKHTLAFRRTGDNDAIHRVDAAGAGKVTLSTLEWHMPFVKPDLVELNKLMAIAATPGAQVPIAFSGYRCSRHSLKAGQTVEEIQLPNSVAKDLPRYVVIAFQTAKSNDQTKNPAVFDHCDLRNVHVTFSSSADQYPYAAYNMDFKRGKFNRAFREFANFNAKRENVEPAIMFSGCGLNEFKSLYPIFVVDTSFRDETVEDASAATNVHLEFNTQIPADTFAYIVTVHDRLFTLESNDKMFTMIK